MEELKQQILAHHMLEEDVGRNAGHATDSSIAFGNLEQSQGTQFLRRGTMLKLIGGSSGEKRPALEQPTMHWKAGTQATIDGPPGSLNATANFERLDTANAVVLEVGKAKRESSGGFI